MRAMTLNEAIELLRSAGVPAPEYDAREIFGWLGDEREPYALIPASTVATEAVEAAIRRRAAREPLQYIIGEVGFYREVYRVSPDCLIPRSDTEILVDYAVRHIPAGERFLDLCTGSGCIAISTLKSTRDTTAMAVDISDGALKIARENAERNGVSERLTLAKCDVLSDEIAPCAGGYFAVLSNPPYIERSVYESLESELFFEPRIALVAEDGGLEFYRRLVPLGLSLLKEGGFVALEIGYDQADALRGVAAEHGREVEIIKDYGGNDRVAVIRK